MKFWDASFFQSFITKDVILTIFSVIDLECNKFETCAEINLVFGSHWTSESILVSWPANGRPRWKQSSFKILLLQANFHSNCAFQIFLRTKWHVLQLLQTRFSIYPIFYHKNQENWIFSMEYFFWPQNELAGQLVLGIKKFFMEEKKSFF